MVRWLRGWTLGKCDIIAFAFGWCSGDHKSGVLIESICTIVLFQSNFCLF